MKESRGRHGQETRACKAMKTRPALLDSFAFSNVSFFVVVLWVGSPLTQKVVLLLVLGGPVPRELHSRRRRTRSGHRCSRLFPFPRTHPQTRGGRSVLA